MNNPILDTEAFKKECEEVLGGLQVIPPMHKASFQLRVKDWMQACFGRTISDDKVERNHRFLEESLELVQSLGCTASEAHQLVNYVFKRPIGQPYQEVGGVQVTLAALGNANSLDIASCGEMELARVWTKVAQIREKQANKPIHSPLPQKAGDELPVGVFVDVNASNGLSPNWQQCDDAAYDGIEFIHLYKQPPILAGYLINYPHETPFLVLTGATANRHRDTGATITEVFRRK